MTRAYYNEHDPYAAVWLRNLIAAGHIAPGDVDERSIEDVTADELGGYTQCHFFAGIGIWSHALRRAGWPDDRPVWTGSCPCQPFSAAGKGCGVDDERHLWPAWQHLIRQRRPPVVLGEQVASPDGLAWLDLVQTDMEGEGYAFGANDLCAAGVTVGWEESQAGEWLRRALRHSGDSWAGRMLRDFAAWAGGNIGEGGHHIRQRLYFAAESQRQTTELTGSLHGGGMADLVPAGWAEGWPGAGHGPIAGCGAAGELAHGDGRDAGAERLQRGGEHGQQQADGGSGQLAVSFQSRLEGHAGHGDRGYQPGRLEEGQDGPVAAQGAAGDTHAPHHLRRPADWLYCRDGRWRAVEPGTFPLAHAAPARVGRLRAYGNGLDGETAEAFIKGYLEQDSGMVPDTAAGGLQVGSLPPTRDRLGGCPSHEDVNETATGD